MEQSNIRRGTAAERSNEMNEPIKTAIAWLKSEAVVSKDNRMYAGEIADQAAAELARLEQERDELREAVAFYAKRYHDEHHQSDSYLNCMAETCQAAAALKAGQA
jgi:hypothetical protein